MTHRWRPRGVLVAGLVASTLAVVAVVAARADEPTVQPPAEVATTAGAEPSTTTATAITPPPSIPSPSTSTTTAPPPAALSSELRAALDGSLADPRFERAQVGVSIRIEGAGEFSSGDDVALLPASNQKLLTAMAALEVLGPESTLTTEVRSSGPVRDGVVVGDLVLVGGGDPSLSLRGPHSLDGLAAQLRARGIWRVAGSLVGDETRHDDARTAPGWLDFHVPEQVGPLSALAVDGNSLRRDAAYLADPLLGNLELFREVLATHGIAVDGEVRRGPVPSGATALAVARSQPVSTLVAGMLLTSDNFTAELLLREVGRDRGGEGSTPAGSAAADAVASSLGVEWVGVTADGSGLSRRDRRSAGEWQRLLHAARRTPWFEALVAGLPVAGLSGTLADRFEGTPAEGVLRAKTGSIIEGRALSGYLETADGRAVTFSIVANGGCPPCTEAAIDDLLVTVAADQR